MIALWTPASSVAGTSAIVLPSNGALTVIVGAAFFLLFGAELFCAIVMGQRYPGASIGEPASVSETRE